MEKLKNRIRKGLIIFVSFTVVAYIVIVFFYLRDIPSNFSLHITFYTLSMAIILFLSLHIFNTLRVYEITKIFSKKFTIKDAFLFTMSGIFLGTITPFQSGGLPLQLYLLKKAGITTGKSTSIIIIRGVQSFFVFLITVPFTFIFFSNLFDGKLISALFRYLIIFYITVVSLMIIFVFFPEKIKNSSEKKMKNEKMKNIIIKIADESINFKNGIIMFFTKGKKRFLLSCFYTMISLYSSFAMTYYIVKFVDGTNDFFLVFHIQLLLTFLLAFVPTPGSSGFAEGGAAIFYSMLVSKEKIIIFIFLWRAVITYIPALIGLILFIIFLRSFYEKNP